MSASEPTSLPRSQTWIAITLSPALHHRDVLGRHAIVGRSPPPHRAGDAVVPALVDRLPHHPSLCLETIWRATGAPFAVVSGTMIVLSITGRRFNTLQWALEHTQGAEHAAAASAHR